MDRKKRNSIIAIAISLVIFAGIILILVFFGSKGNGHLGPVARVNIASIIVALLSALGLGGSRTLDGSRPNYRRFEMSRWGFLGLFMLALFSFIGLMIWLSSELSLSTRTIGVAVGFAIATPMLIFGIRLRRRAQTQQRFSWATFMVWLGSIAAVFFVATLIQLLVLKS